MSPEISIRDREVTYVKSARISAYFTEAKQRAPVNDTAVHEALHVVAAEANGTSVISATIIASGDALGSTHPSRFDAVAAMAAKAHGGTGTGHDEMITVLAGTNPDAAESAARSIINPRWHQVNYVAVALEENGTIYNSQIKDVMNKADEDKKLGVERDVDLCIEEDNGKSEKITLKTRGETIMIPGIWVDFSEN